MQQIECHCGNKINLSEVPVDGEYVCFPSEAWDSTIEALVDAVLHAGHQERTLLGEALSDALAVRVSHFYRCPQCGRLILSLRGAGGLEFFMLERPSGSQR